MVRGNGHHQGGAAVMAGRLVTTGIALWAAVCAGNPARQPPGCLRYEPASVELRGRLDRVMRYGPPGYGETPDADQRLEVPILTLARPIDVCADPNSATNNEDVHAVTEVQLIPGRQVDTGAYVGKDVVAAGTLFRAHAGRHFTPVVMNVRSLGERR